MCFFTVSVGVITIGLHEMYSMTNAFKILGIKLVSQSSWLVDYFVFVAMAFAKDATSALGCALRCDWDCCSPISKTTPT